MNFYPGVAMIVVAVAFMAVTANVSGTALLLWTLRRHGSRIDRLPRASGLFLLIGVALLPILGALAEQRSVVDPLLTVSWVLGGAGIGEEVFFRGYVQSRLNEAPRASRDSCGGTASPRRRRSSTGSCARGTGTWSRRRPCTGFPTS